MKLWEYLKARMFLFSDRIAFTDGSITYGDLINIAEREPVGAGNLRLIECSSRQKAAIEILRCIASGNVAVPVDTGYGRNYIDRIWDMISDDSEIYPDTSFIVFTSGSTGTPKGVMLSENAIIANLKAIENYCDIESGKKLLIIRPLVHISALTGELLFGLCRGLEIEFYNEIFLPQRLAQTLVTRGIQVIGCTPTILFRLNEYLATTHLSEIIVSGERLPAALTEILRRFRDRIKFYNVYGLTENGPRVSALKPNEFFLYPGSVGKAVLNTEIKLCNGELLVRSPSLMDGYYRRPGLTNRVLRDGWLHTGDLSYIDADGYLYILGRKDGMIIRGGLNIFPEDIEIEAAQIDGVSECIVYGEDDLRYGQKICMDYIGTAKEKDVRRHLVDIIPCRMMPDRIRRVESIEKTESGKKKRNK